MKNLEFNIEKNRVDWDRELVGKKLSNLKELQYLTNSEVVNNILLEWQKKQPNNSKVETLINAILQIHFYCHDLKNENELLKLSYEENLNDKLRAIERARRAESKLQSKED